jgi:hypothetical protein
LWFQANTGKTVLEILSQEINCTPSYEVGGGAQTKISVQVQSLQKFKALYERIGLEAWLGGIMFAWQTQGPEFKPQYCKKKKKKEKYDLEEKVAQTRQSLVASHVPRSLGSLGVSK